MKTDKDVAALRAAIRAIERSTCDRMKRATVEFLYDRYIRHPRELIPEQAETRRRWIEGRRG
jgi:hypothetical protein